MTTLLKASRTSDTSRESRPTIRDPMIAAGSAAEAGRAFGGVMMYVELAVSLSLLPLNEN